jgi:hypothetical protein
MANVEIEDNSIRNAAGGIAISNVTGPWTFPTGNTLTGTGRTPSGDHIAAIQLINTTDVTLECLVLTSSSGARPAR